MSVFQFYNTGWGRPPHNTPMQIALELGIVGLVLIVGAYFLTFRQFRDVHKGDGLYDLRVALGASLIGLGFVSLFIGLATYKYFWLTLSTIAQLRTVARSRTHTDPHAAVELPPPRGLRLRPVWRRWVRKPAPAAP